MGPKILLGADKVNVPKRNHAYKVSLPYPFLDLASFLKQGESSLEALPIVSTLMRTRSEAPQEMQASKNRVKFLESPDG